MTIDDAHRLDDEDGLTADFAGNLKRLRRIRSRSGSISFDYQCLSKKTERRLGGDGAIVLSLTTGGRTWEKVLFFQAKKMMADRPRTALRLPSGEDRRLQRQLARLQGIRGSQAAIALFYTRHAFFAVGSNTVEDVVGKDPRALRTPLTRRFYPVFIGDWIAHLVAACYSGVRSPTIIRELRADGLRSYAKRVEHLITVRVRIKQPAAVPSGDAAPTGVAQGLEEPAPENRQLPPRNLIRDLYQRVEDRESDSVDGDDIDRSKH